MSDRAYKQAGRRPLPPLAEIAALRSNRSARRLRRFRRAPWSAAERTARSPRSWCRAAFAHEGASRSKFAPISLQMVDRLRRCRNPDRRGRDLSGPRLPSPMQRATRREGALPGAKPVRFTKRSEMGNRNQSGALVVAARDFRSAGGIHNDERANSSLRQFEGDPAA